MNTVEIILLVCVGVLFALCVFLMAKSIAYRRKENALAEKIESYLKKGEKPVYSVSDDSFAVLHNNVCDLCDTLETQKHINENDNKKNAQFVADVSHQLKTPLAGLRLYTEMNQSENPTENGSKQLELIGKTEKLVFSLLRLQKLKADAYEMNFIKEKLEDIITATVFPFRELFPEKQFSISGNAEVRCDKEWLSEAIGNVIKNACEHTQPDGKVSVSIEKTPSSVTISITDNGGGAGNDEIPHLFERFFRSENSDKNSTGIGLAISKEIIEKHHGIISAQNTAQGLMVSMWLPIVDAAEKI